MLDDDEWSWIEEKATGDFDHLLFGTSLPFLLSPVCTTSKLQARPSAEASGAAQRRGSASSFASSWT